MKSAIVAFATGLADSDGLHVFVNSALANTKASVWILSPDAAPSWIGKVNHRVWWMRVGDAAVPKHREGISHGVSCIRWWHYANWLRSHREFEAVLLADARDVVFQADPFAVGAEACAKAGAPWMLVCSEGQAAKDHAWCREQHKRLIGLLAEPWNDKNEEFNGGSIMGDPATLLELAIWMDAAGRLVAKSGVSDQAALNLYLHKTPPEKLTVARQATDPLYLHGELVKMGKIKPVLTSGVASLAGKPYAIFHQYDRTVHAEAVLQRYGPKWDYPTVVVSRFNENLRWMAKLNGAPQIVFNKGEELGALPHVRTFPLPNVGFEAHTWLHYFAANYEDLSKVTLCLQGNPFDHVPEADVLAVLRRDPDDLSFLPLANPAHGAIQSRDGGPHHRGLGPTLDRLWRELLGGPPPERWHSFYGAQFAVHRDVVRRRPRAWYAKARDLVKTKDEACALERMWGHIFA